MEQLYTWAKHACRERPASCPAQPFVEIQLKENNRLNSFDFDHIYIKLWATAHTHLFQTSIFTGNLIKVIKIFNGCQVRMSQYYFA